MQSRLVRALFNLKGEYWFEEVIWADESGSFSLLNITGANRALANGQQEKQRPPAADGRPRPAPSGDVLHKTRQIF